MAPQPPVPPGPFRTSHAAPARRPQQLVRVLLGLLVGSAGWALGTVSPAAGQPAAAVRSSDLGKREIRGRAYDLSAGPDALIAGATVTYARLGSRGRAVTTDERGEFSFALPLHDTDDVRISAAAPGFSPATITLSAADVVYRFPTIELGLLPAQSGHRISGHLTSDVFCSRDADGVGITLEPTGRSTLTAADGTFAFEHVVDGDYILHIESGDFDVPVAVAGDDAVVQFCISCADALNIEPRSGLPGTSVAAQGSCYALHSGHLGVIYFDDTAAAEVRGDTPGAFRTTLAVPVNTEPGPHRIRLLGGTRELASKQFVVRSASAGCPGDCDRDTVVTVGELVRGVGMALGVAADDCSAYDSAAVDIAGLIAAVDSALNGCGKRPA